MDQRDEKIEVLSQRCGAADRRVTNLEREVERLNRSLADAVLRAEKAEAHGRDLEAKNEELASKLRTAATADTAGY